MVGGPSYRQLGFQHEGFVTGGIVYLEQLLAQLKVRGMHALIDMHAMPGGASFCQSYAGISTNQPGFWTGGWSSDGTNLTHLPACPGAGPYTSSRPGSGRWMDVGLAAVRRMAAWIVSIEHNASLSGVVQGLEVVNEPGLGFNGMIGPIKAYHTQIIPTVQQIFREANVSVNVTVNFIGPNDSGMGLWLRQQIDAQVFDGRSLLVDFHNCERTTVALVAAALTRYTACAQT